MKKIILGIGLLFYCAFAKAQNGLENIIVEKYYVSNAADAAGSAGTLPVGSVTYRIYADLLPGYKFQAIYGIASHELRLSSSTSFFNNEDRGATNPNGITAANTRLNTVMLDSWFSVGATATGKMGVLKTEDTDGSIGNANGILQNADPIAGIAINTQDGMIAGTPETVTFVGLTTELDVFNATSQLGNLFTTTNGSVASLNGSAGPTADNKVLLGQFTTDGTFCYELNIQIGTPLGGVENYVAQNPTGLEISIPSLMGCIAPDIYPTVTIDAPLNNASYITGNTVNISATAGDVDGTVSSVEFFVNGVSIGLGVFDGLTSTWDISWISTTGNHQLTALATDNDGGSTLSDPVTIHVAPAHQPYGVVTTSNTCYPSTFCLPIEAQDAVSNVIGYDLVLHYDKTKVTPTGTITVNNALIQPSYVNVASSTNTVLGTINISLYFNASAPANTKFNGTGTLFCVEFSKTAGFVSIDTAVFSVTDLQESYVTGVSQQLVDDGNYFTYKDSAFSASLNFWSDNSPIKYDAIHPSDYLITNIYGNNGSCNSESAVAVQPNLAGSFVYNLNNGLSVSINKDITPTTDVQPVINGFDAFLTRKVLINDLSFIPNIYQTIAMDVNTDGVISAGDLSQINQRTVLLIPEYKQSWNYTSTGNPIPGLGASKDWLFVDISRVSANPAYSVSSTYPSDDGVGFSKSRVPNVPFCLSVPLASATSCQLAASETYKGILLGDVNGNYATVIPNNMFRQSGTDKVVFDLSKAVVAEGYVDVPVSVESNSPVHSLDFALELNSGVTFHSVVDHTDYMETLSNHSADDNTVRFTSNSLQNFDLGKSLVSVRFAVNGSEITASDLKSVNGFINGERVGAEVKGAGAMANANVDLYPNPANGVLNVVVSENATVQLMDVEGRQVVFQTNVNANQKHEISTQNIASGIYMMKVYNDNFVSMKKVVINK